jgi:RHS repeat-associated protein
MITVIKRVLALCIALLPALSLFAGGDAVLARGFKPDGVYQLGTIDGVNTFNGNLTATVPLGPEYHSNGTLQYRFSLSYNSNAWDYYYVEGVNVSSPNMYDLILESDYALIHLQKYWRDLVAALRQLSAPRSGLRSQSDDSTVSGTESVPTGNAGMGWTFSLGELRGAVSDTVPSSLTYVDERGAASSFTPSLHGDWTTASAPAGGRVGYTNDSTYLRIRAVGAASSYQREVDFPDGIRKHFTCVADCTGRRPQWNLDWIADPFGNVLLVERYAGANRAEKRPATGSWEWRFIEATFPDAESSSRTAVYYNGTASDRAAVRVIRTHYAFFAVTSSWELRLERLHLAGHGGKFATYELTYPSALTAIPRDLVPPWPGDGLIVPYIRNGAADDGKILVSLLTGIVGPDPAGTTTPSASGNNATSSSRWSFEYFLGEDATEPYNYPKHYPVSRTSGRLKKLRLPTGGGYDYAYGTRVYPTRGCHEKASSSPGVVFTSISRRQKVNASGTAEGKPWLYGGGSWFSAADGPLDPACGTDAARDFVTATIDPQGVVTQAFFQLIPHEDMGLPMTRNSLSVLCRDGSASCTNGIERKLSTRTLQGTWSDFASDPTDALRRMFPKYLRTGEALTGGTPLRSTFVEYERSATLCPDGPMVTCRQSNARLVGQHTIYHDEDPSPNYVYTETVSAPASFDGLGHYRLTEEWGNLLNATASTKPLDHRVTFVDFNHPDDGVTEKTVTYVAGGILPINAPAASNPDSPEPWFIQTYSQSAKWEAGKAFQALTLFDNARGYLTSSRVLTDASDVLNAAPSDLRTVTSADLEAIHDKIAGNRGQNDLLTSTTRATTTRETQPAVEVHTRSYGGDVSGGFSGWFQSSKDPVYDSVATMQYGTTVSTGYAGCDAAHPFLTSFTSTVDPASGLVTSTTDLTGAVTSFTYDVLGRITSVTPPLEDPETYTYRMATGTLTNALPDGNWLRIQRGGTNGPMRTYNFDHFGRLLRREVAVAGNKTAWTAYTYEPDSGALDTTKNINSSGGADAVTTYDYDVFGRPKLVRQPDGTTVTTSYAGVRRVGTATSNVALLSSTDSVVKGMFYDSFGRLRRVNERQTNTDKLARGDYTYDAVDHLTKVTINDNQPRVFTYDGRGLLTSETHPEMPSVTVQHKEYDPRGHSRLLHFAQDGSGTTPTVYDLKFVYDAAERVQQVKMAVPVGKASTTGLVTLKDFVFAPQQGSAVGTAGQLIQATRRNVVPDPVNLANMTVVEVTQAYQYDSAGRPTRTTLSSPYNAGAGRRFSATTTYAYDTCGTGTCGTRMGLITRLTYPGIATCPTCPAQGPARTIDATFDKGVLSGLTASGVSALAVASFAYHSNASLERITRTRTGGVFEDVIAADPSGMVRPGGFTWGGFKKFNGGEYAYDGMGNVSMISDGSGVDQYKYDAAGRIVKASVAGQEQTYDYDSYGNLLKLGDREFIIEQGSNQLLKSTPGLGINDVQYDLVGNLVSIADNRPIEKPSDCVPNLAFTYDALGSMTRFAGCNIGRVFLYDANDQRVATIDYKHGAPFKELWTLRGPNHSVIRDLERAGGTWTWKKDYVYAASSLLSTVGPGEVWSDIHLDHLGTVRLVTDPAGRPIGSSGVATGPQKYWPFGTPVFAPTPERLAFTSHERDDDGSPSSEADLDYMHARYYSPAYGRFFSLDPVMGSLTSPQSWNRFTYVRNNPMNGVDPDGRQQMCPVQQTCPVAASPGFLAVGSSIAVGFTPAGVFMDFATFLSGEDALTGERVPRLIGAIGLIPGASEFRKFGGSRVFRTIAQGVRVGNEAAVRAVTSGGRRVLSFAIDAFEADSKRDLIKWMYRMRNRAEQEAFDDIRVTFMKPGGLFTEADRAMIESFKDLGNYRVLPNTNPGLITLELQITKDVAPPSSLSDLIKRATLIDPNG